MHIIPWKPAVFATAAVIVALVAANIARGSHPDPSPTPSPAPTINAISDGGSYIPGAHLRSMLLTSARRP